MKKLKNVYLHSKTADLHLNCLSMQHLWYAFLQVHQVFLSSARLLKNVSCQHCILLSQRHVECQHSESIPGCHLLFVC